MTTLLQLTQEENGTVHVSSDVYPIQTSFMSLPEPVNEHPDLAQALKQWRKEKAKELEVSAFIVLTNRTLLDLSNMCPSSTEDMKHVKGMGPSRIENYGREILDIVANYMESHPCTDADPDTGELSVS